MLTHTLHAVSQRASEALHCGRAEEARTLHPKRQRLHLHLSRPRLIIYHFKQEGLTLAASQQPLLLQLWTRCHIEGRRETEPVQV